MRIDSFELTYRYTLADLKKRTVHILQFEKPKARGALITAAIKNYKGYMMLHFLYGIHGKEDLDMTPTLAHKLIDGLFNRSISNRTITEIYGRGKGNHHGKKSPDFGRVDELVERYKPEARDLAAKMSTASYNAVQEAKELVRELQEIAESDESE